MLITKAARRYASALFGLAEEQGDVERIREDVLDIHYTLQDSKELVVFLRSPIIKLEDKVEALKTLFFDDLQDSTQQFIKLLAQKDRIALLPQITEAFDEKYRDYAGILTVDVSVARKMNDRQKEELREQLEQKTQKKIDLNINLDESLKGGMAIRIGDTVIDGTVKHKVAELEKTFLSAAV